MNQAVIGLSLTYVALAALLLGIFLQGKLPTWIKFACIILISSFYYLTYHSFLGMLGWPTQQQLPEQFQLMASTITEPDDSTGEEGVIHIWVTAFVDNRPAREPRAYELPYDLDLHASLDEALHEQRQGNVQLGRRLVEIEDPNLPKDTSRFGQQRQRLEFFELPELELPQK